MKISWKISGRQSEEVARDTERTERLVTEAYQKAGKEDGRIGRMRQDLDNLLRMVRAWAKGDYKKVPFNTILLAIGGILYFVNPFDAVHDYLPLMGFVDDATVIAMILRSIKGDLREFLIWEKHSR